MTEGPKMKKNKTEKYCFLPNIQSNLKLVNLLTPRDILS